MAAAVAPTKVPLIPLHVDPNAKGVALMQLSLIGATVFPGVNLHMIVEPV